MYLKHLALLILALLVDALAAKILADQTTLGVQTSTSAKGVTTAVGVTGVTTLVGVDVLLDLVQGILDGPAQLAAGAALPAGASAERGLYTPGTYLGGYATRVFSKDDARINYDLSFLAVDAFGRIAGVATDVTYPGSSASVKSTKWILGEAYNMNGASAAIVNNQGTAGFKRTTVETTVTLDQVSGVSINVAGLLKVVDLAIADASDWSLTDGTYFVEENGTIMYVGIAAGSGILDVPSLFNSGLYAANSTFSFSLKASENAPIVNLGSGVTDSGKNAIYLELGTNILKVGSLEFFGDISVVVVSKSFDLRLFDRSALATPSIVLWSSGAAIDESVSIALTGLDYEGRNVSRVTVTIFSGTTTTELAVISFVPGTTFPIGSGVGADVLSFGNSGLNITSELTMKADLADAPATGNTATIVYEYKYYLASKEVVAVLPDKQSLASLPVNN